MAKRVGKYSVQLEKQINMVGGAAIVGKLEKEGPLGEYFDYALEDDLWNEDSWEKAETKMFYEATRMAVKNSGLMAEDIQLMMGGDLLNQLIAAGFAARQMDFPFLGLYGACSTMAESLIVGSMAIDAGFAQRVACCVTSHFSTAERQYRTPLELGTQRTPTAQRTVTGAGASVLAGEGIGPRIKSCTIGKVIDYGVKDANNMGAAMAPAAYDTLSAFFQDTGTRPDEYDLILTGDLGELGHRIVLDLFAQQGVELGNRYQDCGMLLYDRERQDMHAGASGCGCSASVLNGYLLTQLRRGKWKRILFAPTGALLSPTSSFQGESIPGVCHALCFQA